MTPKEEGAMLTDIKWIKETLRTHCDSPDQKNIGAYKKMTWFNLTGLVGMCLYALRSHLA